MKCFLINLKIYNIIYIQDKEKIYTPLTERWAFNLRESPSFSQRAKMEDYGGGNVNELLL